MKRREVWWVSFDPSIGGEIKKKRPAVIISNQEGVRSALDASFPMSQEQT